MNKSKPVYTEDFVRGCTSEMLSATLNIYVEELEILRKYRDLLLGVEEEMKSGKIRLIAPVLADGKFSEFLVVRMDAVHYSSKLLYVLDSRK